MPYPQYEGNLYIYTNADGYSNYNAPLLKLEKRISGAQPGAWSGYGTIGSTQQNFPRQMQLSRKIFY